MTYRMSPRARTVFAVCTLLLALGAVFVWSDWTTLLLGAGGGGGLMLGMARDNDQVVYSEEKAWSANLNHSFTMQFLSKLPGGLDRWAIRRLNLVVEYTITPDAGVTAVGEDFWRIIRSLTLHDAGGVRIKPIKGENLRVVAQALLGDRFADQANSGVGAATTGKLYMPIPLTIDDGRGMDDPRDAELPARALRKGVVQIVASAAALMAATVNVTSATFYLEAECVRRRGRRRERPVRLLVEEQDLTQAEHHLPTSGRAIASYLYANKGAGGATGANSWSTYTTVESSTFDYVARKRESLREAYRRNRARASGDEVLADDAIALFDPKPGAKLKHFEHVDDIHIKLGAAPPANAVAIILSVPDVPPRFSAAATRIKEHAVDAVVASRGAVATRDGRKVAIKSVGQGEARSLPVKLG